MEFKDNLKKLREEKRLTQEFIADEIGISRQSVSKWEKGQSEPDIETLKKLCEILNCQINDLIDGPNIKEKKGINTKTITKLLFAVGIIFIVAFITFAILFIVNVVNYNNFFVEAKQAGIEGVGGYFNASEYNQMALKIGEKAGAADPILYGTTILNANYTNYGGVFWYNSLNPNGEHIEWAFMILMIAFAVLSASTIIAFLMIKKRK